MSLRAQRNTSTPDIQPTHTVVLVGRTNVGKSTLFNKLTESYQAMVSDIEGTTRDVKRSVVSWQANSFELIDTGGLTPDHLTISLKKLKEHVKEYRAKDPKKITEDEIDLSIVLKAREVVEQSDIALLVVDTRTGILPEDREIAAWLKKKGIPVVVAANKADNAGLRSETSVFFKLGITDPIPISAASGSGTGDLLDEIIAQLTTLASPEEVALTATDHAKKHRPINVSIIGRPNVGKSSLINALLGEDRVIVSPIAHTTREPIDTDVQYKDRTITLIDTAGIRRKARIPFKSLEKQGVTLSLKSLKRSDIVLLVVDAKENINKQDMKLAHEAAKARVGIVIVVNKIDLLDNLKDADHLQVIKSIQATFNFVKWAPVIMLSALTARNTHKVLDMVLDVEVNYNRRIPQEELDQLREELVRKQPPPKKRGAKQGPKVLGFKQLSVAPPHFELVFKGTGMIPLTYLRYFERHIRDRYDYSGSPVIIHQRKL